MRGCAGKGAGKQGDGSDDEDYDRSGGQKRRRDSPEGGTARPRAPGGQAPTAEPDSSNTGGGSGAGPAASGGGSGSPPKKSLGSPAAKKAKLAGTSKPGSKARAKSSSSESKENTSLAGNSVNGEEAAAALASGKAGAGQSGALKQRSSSLGQVARKSGVDRSSLDDAKKQPTLSAFLKPVKR